MKPHTLIATWFGSGFSPKAPGTAGSLAALPFAWVIHHYAGATMLFYAACTLFILGTWATRKYLEETGKEDPGEVVVDEVAAMWLMVASLPFSLQFYAAAFVVFRIFDALKPWPISLADRTLKGAFGVMFDDVLAALIPLVLWGITLNYFMISGRTDTLAAIYAFMGVGHA